MGDASHFGQCDCPRIYRDGLTKGLRENPKRLEAMIGKIPLGRLGKPAEIVGAAIYLSSHAASYVTGQIPGIDGRLYVGLGRTPLLS